MSMACSPPSAHSPDIASPSGESTALPAANDVLAALHLVNGHFIAKWPDPTIDIVRPKRVWPSNIWTRAVYYEGLMGLRAVEPDEKLAASYYDYAVRWGESPAHPWQVGFGDATTVDADMHACGQTYLDLYAVDPEPVRIAQLDESIRHLIDSGNTAVWTWIDAIQMAMPVFARLGVLRSDKSYLEAMWRLYAHTRNVEGGGLLDPKTGLWWRDSSFNPGEPYTRSPNGIDVYWSRGNGWVLAAFARVLDVLPPDEPGRPALEADFRALAAALLPLQRQDGFWNSSLADPNHCAAAGEPGEDGPETSGTALFAYSFAWGIRKGLLDIETYGPPLVAAWNGLTRVAVRSDGFLGWVQSTGAAPCTGREPLGTDGVPDFEDFGVGCFLLAGSEVLRLGEQRGGTHRRMPSAPRAFGVGSHSR
jgi:unsaturated rhamnogalacturonyl hydrolase